MCRGRVGVAVRISPDDVDWVDSRRRDFKITFLYLLSRFQMTQSIDCGKKWDNNNNKNNIGNDEMKRKSK